MLATCCYGNPKLHAESDLTEPLYVQTETFLLFFAQYGYVHHTENSSYVARHCNGVQQGSGEGADCDEYGVRIKRTNEGEGLSEEDP